MEPREAGRAAVPAVARFTVPTRDNLSAPVRPIPGTVPSLVNLPAQCRFLDRCSLAAEACRAPVPMAHHPTAHRVRCVRAQAQPEIAT